MANTTDTIVAVSSPPGRSPRGLVRLSGDAVPDVLAALIGQPLTPRMLTVCRIDDTLPALATFFQSPASYTGQDMAELQCPGNPALLDRLVHRAIGLGARLAEPGEFTFRAFLAGKLDLTQAEGVAATISAVSDSQLQASAHLRDGTLGRLAVQLADRIATQLALVEAGIDFVDQEDVAPITPAALDGQLAGIQRQLGDLLSRSRSWGAIEALPRVVLVGLPSTGKSTLFNALLGRTRAVISPTPGTTRDVLAEPLALLRPDGRRVEVMLVDMAGLDTPAGALDRHVQAAARNAIASADLVLSISAGEATPELTVNRAVPIIHVRSKIDLGGDIPDGAVGVSAVTGAGLDALRRRMAEALGRRGVSLASDMLALQPRHEAALKEAGDALASARDLLRHERSAEAITHAELVAQSLRAGLDALSALAGRMTPDDVLGRIFATFCIGK